MKNYNLDFKFKKGDVVVLLDTCNGDPDAWGQCLKTNYCYKLNEDADSHNFRVEKDCVGNTTNGWWSNRNTYPKSYLNMRLATFLESSMYNKYDRPFNICDFTYEHNSKEEDMSYLTSFINKINNDTQ